MVSEVKLVANEYRSRIEAKLRARSLCLGTGISNLRYFLFLFLVLFWLGLLWFSGLLVVAGTTSVGRHTLGRA